MSNISYLEDFLNCYKEHIEQYEALIYLLSLLPYSYQYLFARNLLEYEELLVDGDYYNGVKPEGMVVIDEGRVFLVKGEGRVTLLVLPPVFEV